MFVHLTDRTKFIVHVRSFIKRTNINELSAKRFTNCSLNVRFVYSPIQHFPELFTSTGPKLVTSTPKTKLAFFEAQHPFTLPT
ncbi:hypothetical protein Hanom_Chr10g00875041 [Helianthus anomalus]